MNLSSNNKTLIKFSPQKFLILFRILFGLLFIFSGLMKITNLFEFQEAVKNFALIPDSYAKIVSYAVPIIEIVVGIFIAINRFTIFVLKLDFY